LWLPGKFGFHQSPHVSGRMITLRPRHLSHHFCRNFALRPRIMHQTPLQDRTIFRMLDRSGGFETEFLQNPVGRVAFRQCLRSDTLHIRPSGDQRDEPRCHPGCDTTPLVSGECELRDFHAGVWLKSRTSGNCSRRVIAHGARLRLRFPPECQRAAPRARLHCARGFLSRGRTLRGSDR
jgi:hypothetical protein